MSQEFKTGPLSAVWAKLGQYRMWVLVSPAFLQVLLFFVLPILFLLRISFNPVDPVARYAPGFTLANYFKFYSDPFYLNTFLFTFKLTVVVTVVTLIMAYPVAYLIAKAKPVEKGVYLTLLLVCMWTQYIVKIYGLVAILSRDGMINVLLVKLGIVKEPIGMLYNFFAVTVGLVHITFPYMVLSLLGVLEKIDKSD